jgi:hypothetical protein
LAQSLIELSGQGIFIATIASQKTLLHATATVPNPPLLELNHIHNFDPYCAQELHELRGAQFHSISLAAAKDSAIVVYTLQQQKH